MIRYHISIVFLILASCILQQFLPAVTGFHDARIHIFALTFLCCAVTVGFSPMLTIAFLCGLIWDAQNSLGAHGGDPLVYDKPVENLRFGYSIVLYGIMGVIMQGVQPLFRKGVWQLSALLTGVAILFYLLSEYLLISIVRGDFYFPKRVFYQMLLSAWLTMLVSPLIFLILFKLAKWSRFTIRFDGLKRPRLRLNRIQPD